MLQQHDALHWGENWSWLTFSGFFIPSLGSQFPTDTIIRQIEAARDPDLTVQSVTLSGVPRFGDILVVGGYGVVGRRIAAELGPDYPNRVIISGRNLAKAENAAAVIGQGVRGRAIDITVPSSLAEGLDGVGVVISCIDQPGRSLLWAAVERGLGYTDVTPHLTELGRGPRYDKIDAAARASGARLVLGAGIVPGISSVIVHALAGALGGADEVETALLLGAADVSGPASF